MEQLYEELIQILLGKGFGSVDGWFSDDEISALRKVLLKRYNNDCFRQARIGDRFNETKELDIRSDEILWLSKDSDEPVEQLFFNKLDGFVEYLNRTCYAGVRSYEFHYAVYDEGSFYKRHKDQFNTDDRRKYSFVLYLTDNWQKGDGGELVIYNGEQTTIEPIAGILVFFTSDLEHEVLVSNTKRLSLTGWLKTY